MDAQLMELHAAKILMCSRHATIMERTALNGVATSTAIMGVIQQPKNARQALGTHALQDASLTVCRGVL